MTDMTGMDDASFWPRCSRDRWFGPLAVHTPAHWWRLPHTVRPETREDHHAKAAILSFKCDHRAVGVEVLRHLRQLRLVRALSDVAGLRPARTPEARAFTVPRDAEWLAQIALEVKVVIRTR